MAPAIPYIALALAAAGTAASIGQQKKAQSAQEQALRAQQRLDKLANNRQRLEQIRRARSSRAEIVASGEGSGAAGSSAVAGGTSSVSTQLASNLSFLNKSEELGSFITNQNLFASAAQTKSSIFQGISSFALAASGPASRMGAGGGGGVEGLSEAQADWASRTGN